MPAVGSASNHFDGLSWRSIPPFPTRVCFYPTLSHPCKAKFGRVAIFFAFTTNHVRACVEESKTWRKRTPKFWTPVPPGPPDRWNRGPAAGRAALRGAREGERSRRGEHARRLGIAQLVRAQRLAPRFGMRRPCTAMTRSITCLRIVPDSMSKGPPRVSVPVDGASTVSDSSTASAPSRTPSSA